MPLITLRKIKCRGYANKLMEWNRNTRCAVVYNPLQFVSYSYGGAENAGQEKAG